jgi:DNA-directed RNA polymerase subunit RPC12/RpoP
MKEKIDVICLKCNHKWKSKSKLIYTSCPSCKTPIRINKINETLIKNPILKRSEENVNKENNILQERIIIKVEDNLGGISSI